MIIKVEHSFDADPCDASDKDHKRAGEAPVRPDGHSWPPICSMHETANVADPFSLDDGYTTAPQIHHNKIASTYSILGRQYSNVDTGGT